MTEAKSLLEQAADLVRQEIDNLENSTTRGLQMS
jgi:hypothetical protein